MTWPVEGAWWNRSALSRAGGFSLLEAVVALAVIGSVSVTALAAFGAELRASQRARIALEAQALAEERLAQLRLLERDELVALPDSVARGTFAAPWQAYAWTSVTSGVAGNPDLFDARVTVSGPNGTHELASRLYRPPRIGAGR